MHFAPLRNHTSQDNILRYQLYQLRQFRDKNRFFESRGSVDILGKRKPDLIPVGRTFSNRQETRGFVGAGLAPPAVTAPPAFSSDEDVDRASPVLGSSEISFATWFFGAKISS